LWRDLSLGLDQRGFLSVWSRSDCADLRNAGIFRFQRFYRKWAEQRPFGELKDKLYDYYYDQAHFTKEFKRMTNFSPEHFTVEVFNEFGRRLSLG
jgi:hypothetical protein